MFFNKEVIGLKKIFIGLICVFLFFQVGFANQEIEVSWQELFTQSIAHLYNEEYREAIECLEAAEKISPDNPAIYWRLTYSYAARMQCWKDFLPEIEIEKLKTAFYRDFDKGVAICKSANLSEPEILFYLGGLYGNRIIFKDAIKQRDKSILNDTKEARKYLEQIEENDAFYYEARGYLGIMNYWPAILSLSFFEKIKLKLVYKWYKKLGLEQIRDSINYSRYSDDMKFTYSTFLTLLILTKKEKDRVAEAINLIQGLAEKYPNSIFFRSELGALKEFLNKE